VERLANFIANQTGKPWALPVAIVVLVAWLKSGLPIDTINLGISIVTFLMFFPVQFTQTRDTKAEHAKLDSVVDATPADSKLKGIETRPIAEIERAKGD
jgi:low affinity Fe/Cu permease